MTLLYALGHARHQGSIRNLFDSLIELEDHEGWLTIVSRRELYRFEREAFEIAWEDIGNEPRENMTFELRKA